MKFFHLLVALLLVTAPHAVYAQEDEDCGIYCHGIGRELKRSTDVRCVPFAQPHRDTVVLTLTLKNGKKLPYRKVNAGENDCIPVGRHWLRNKTKSMYICNKENHASYPIEDVLVIAQQEKYERVPANTACLFGREVCKKIGFTKIEPVKQ